jgi:xylulokinase
MPHQDWPRASPSSQWTSASPFWLSLLADGLGRDVTTVTGAAEGGAYGAALVAGVGAGAWANLDQAVGVIRETLAVRSDPLRRALLEKALPVHSSRHPALEATFSAIAALPTPTGGGIRDGSREGGA